MQEATCIAMRISLIEEKIASSLNAHSYKLWRERFRLPHAFFQSSIHPFDWQIFTFSICLFFHSLHFEGEGEYYIKNLPQPVSTFL